LAKLAWRFNFITTVEAANAKKNGKKSKKEDEYGGRDLSRDGATVFADIEHQLKRFVAFGGVP
jgi:hypothetical protein